MFVLSRYLGEGIRINERLMLTLAVIGTEFVDLALSTGDEIKPKIVSLGVGKTANITPEIRVRLVMIKEGKARPGFDGPRSTRYER